MGLISWCRRLLSRAEQSSNQADICRAAESGDAEAQFVLGRICCNASGTCQNIEQGLRWYRKAAEQGHPVAQFHLALMFTDGTCVPRDEAAALIWTHRAAEGGAAGAQFTLGSRSHRASLDRGRKDSVESRTEAYKWFQLAEAQGYEGSCAARERVALSMTRDEVVDGDKRVAAFAVRKVSQPLPTPSFGTNE